VFTWLRLLQQSASASNNCYQLIPSLHAGADGMGFVFTWLRMSSSKILTWARRSNYQSKDIAWMQKVTSERMTEKVGRV
jgi:hypothetical protein